MCVSSEWARTYLFREYICNFCNLVFTYLLAYLINLVIIFYEYRLQGGIYTYLIRISILLIGVCGLQVSIYLFHILYVFVSAKLGGWQKLRCFLIIYCSHIISSRDRFLFSYALKDRMFCQPLRFADRSVIRISHLFLTSFRSLLFVCFNDATILSAVYH